MAETGQAADGMTDRELLVDIWEIVAGLEAKVDRLENEFAPVARKYRRLAGLPIGRAATNGRHHGPD
jgi:hypothetical protein